MNQIKERTEVFSNKLRQLMEWEEHENNKIISHLKSEGKVLGLDGSTEALAHIRKERNRRLENLLKEYSDLPPGTRLKLW